MKKNIYCLILTTCYMQFSLAMSPDLADPDYIEIKKQLIKEVKKNDIYAVKQMIIKCNEYVRKTLGLTTFEEELNARETFEKYEKDLLLEPKSDSAIDIALNQGYFKLLGQLLDRLNIDYIDFLEKSKYLRPDLDIDFKIIKDQLINAAKSNNVNQTEKTLRNFYIHIRKPFEFTDPVSNVKAHKYYLETLDKYLGNLLPQSIEIAAKKENFAIIYLLLNQLTSQNFFEKNIDSIKPIINLDNQPINALLNNIIITRILDHLKTAQKDVLINFLKELINVGLTQKRLQHALVQAFALYSLSSEYHKANTATINSESLIQNSFVDNNFENDLEKEQFSADLIHYMAIMDLQKAVELINNPKINLNETDIHGDTVLILAIDKSISPDYQEIADLLLKKLEVNVNQPGQEGKTPLMHAIEQKNMGIVLLLLSKNANPKLKDIFGKNALDYAKKEGNDKIIKLIEESIQQQQMPAQISINEQIQLLSTLNSTLASLANKI